MVARGGGRKDGGTDRWNTEEFKGSETILFDTVMVDPFVKTQRAI